MAKKRKSSSIELELNEITPLTKNQELAFNSKKNMVLCGSAGTGKSFVACYIGFNEISKNNYDDIIIIRSAVPTRDIGYLPGNEKEKTQIYEAPYYALCSEMFHRGDAYEILKTKGVLKFMTTSFLRGITLTNSFIIIDEIQNMSAHELDSLITRIGEDCCVILCGDFKQSDLKENGMKHFLSILKEMPEYFDIIEYGIEDVVRSGFVKEYLRTKERIDSAKSSS